MIPIVFKYLTPKGYRGITLFPFVIAKNKEALLDPIFINHEKIHLRQQLELLVLPFFIWYGVEFLLRWIQLKDRRRAYYAISFEQEAYSNEKDFDYLNKRTFASFLKFVAI